MKKFHFTLEKVLAWRRTQQTVAEAALARLLDERRAVRQARRDLLARHAEAQGALARSAATHGAELANLESPRIRTGRENRKLAVRLVELEKALEDQKRVVIVSGRAQREDAGTAARSPAVRVESRNRPRIRNANRRMGHYAVAAKAGFGVAASDSSAVTRDPRKHMLYREPRFGPI